MKLSLSVKTLIALLLGLGIGLNFREAGIFISAAQILGILYLHLLQLVMVPLVLTALALEAAKLSITRRLGLLTIKCLAYFMLTAALAVTLGLAAANLIDPGRGLTLPAETHYAGQAPLPLAQNLTELIPSNPFQALISGNILQIMVMATLLGLGMNAAGDKARALLSFLMSLEEVISRLIQGLLVLAPLGTFALIVPVAASHGINNLLHLWPVILTVSAACLLHAAIVYSLAVQTLAGMKPGQFLKGISPAMLAALSTSSSSATLPISLHVVEENLRVSKQTANFVMPLGAAVNIDGTAIYQGVCAVFVAQVFGGELSFGQQLTVISTVVLASVGTAGLPGSGLIMLTLVLQSVGLPLEGLVLIAGIDPLLQRAVSAVNVTGSASAAVVIEKSGE